MSTKEVAEKYFKAEDDAFLKGDFITLSMVQDINIVFHIGPSIGDIVGHEAYKQYILNIRK